MDAIQKSHGNRWIAVLWVIIFLLVAALALFVGQKMKSSPVAPTGPHLTTAFPDGGSLEIIGVSVKERLVEISPPKMFSFSFFSSTGATGGSYGGLNFYTKEEGGKDLTTRFTSETPAAMFMEFRMKDADGRGMVFPTYLAQRDRVDEDPRLTKAVRAIEFLNPATMELETLRAAMDKSGMQVLFQQHDPDAGWVNLMGPSLIYEPWPDRYIVTLNAWRRDLPTLDFRAIRADGEVTEFSLPNPDFRKTPAKVAPPLVLPYVHKAADFKLTVKGIRRVASPGKLPLAALDLKLEYTGSPVPGLKDGPVRMVWKNGAATDEWGNVVGFDRQNIRKKSLTGAMLPMKSKRLSFDLTVERTEDYPHSPHTGFMVLEGKVTDDGLAIAFEPGPDAAFLGITTMPVCKISKTKIYERNAPTKGWNQLKMTVHGKVDQLKTVQKRIGDISDCEFHVFVGDKNESSGLAFGGMNSGSSSGGGVFRFDRTFARQFPPGDLAPGTHVRVAMDAPMANENIHLDLELPATVDSE